MFSKTAKVARHLQYRKEQFTRLLKRVCLHLYIWSNVKHIHGLKHIPRSNFDCILLSVIKDCEDYLETFIEYYLALGIKHIVFIDNGSKDTTISLASKYEQVTILKCHLSFAKYKRDMRQFLLDRYSFNHWCLLVDCDEFFDYPYSKKHPLRSFLEWLDSCKYDAVITHMLDMFPCDAIQKQSHEKNSNFRHSHRWFEIASIAQKTIPSGLSNTAPTESDLKLNHGGVRNRVFNNSPFISKFALLKPNIRLQLVGSHLVKWANIADINCILLHYKFLPRFIETVDKAVKEKQYYNDSSEYKRYQEVLLNNTALNLYSEHSIEYKDIDQLIEIGFLKVNKKYAQLNTAVCDK